MPRSVLIALIAMVVLTVGALLALRWRAASPAVAIDAPGAVDPTVHHFTLMAHTGQPFSDTALRGRPALLYFGFTFCPDICPTELGYIAKVLRALGPDGDRVTPVFISVDPGRDTPAVLAGYVPLFDHRMIGLVGTAVETAAVAKEFGVFYQKTTPVSRDPSYYVIDHTSTIFVLDAQGRIADTFDSETPVAVATARVRRLLP